MSFEGRAYSADRAPSADPEHSLISLWRAAVGTDPTRPVLTYYDDATGERTELSGATLDNWVAKTANLLVDGLALEPGGQALVLLPPHWQTAAVLLGCWSAGLLVADAPTGGTPEIVFAASADVDPPPGAGDRYLLGLSPMALPLATVPEGWYDFVAEVRVHGDRFVPMEPVTGRTAATAEDSHAGLVAAAHTRAGALGIRPGDRVLVDGDSHPGYLDWLLAPLAGGASIVLCRHLDPGRLAGRIAAEKVSRTVGAGVQLS